MTRETHRRWLRADSQVEPEKSRGAGNWMEAWQKHGRRALYTLDRPAAMETVGAVGAVLCWA